MERSRPIEYLLIQLHGSSLYTQCFVCGDDNDEDYTSTLLVLPGSLLMLADQPSQEEPRTLVWGICEHCLHHHLQLLQHNTHNLQHGRTQQSKLHFAVQHIFTVQTTPQFLEQFMIYLDEGLLCHWVRWGGWGRVNQGQQLGAVVPGWVVAQVVFNQLLGNFEFVLRVLLTAGHHKPPVVPAVDWNNNAKQCWNNGLCLPVAPSDNTHYPHSIS